MEKDKLEQFIRDAIEKAKTSKQGNEKDYIKSVVMDFYRIVADGYGNRVPIDIHKIFTRVLPSFKQYFEGQMEKERTQVMRDGMNISSLESDIERLDKKIADVSSQIINVEPNKTKRVNSREPVGASTHDFIRGDTTQYRTVQRNEIVPSENMGQVRRMLGLMVTESSMQDVKELEKGLMDLFLMQIKTANGKRFVQQDMHNAFMEAYPEFAQVLERYNSRHVSSKAELEGQRNETELKLTSAIASRKTSQKQVISVYDESKEKRQAKQGDPCSRGSRRARC